MGQIDVLWYYEHVDREMDIACAVKALVEQTHDLHIEIVQHPYGEMVANYQHLRPRLVLMPAVQGSYIPYLLEWPDAICVNLRWEQLFYKGIVANKILCGDLAINHVIHHAWSEFGRDDLKSQGVPENHIYVNGNPVYSLCQSPYSSYFASRAALAKRYQLDPAKKWLFFPENYKWAFFDDASISRKKNPQAAAEMKAYCVTSLEQSLKWCADLAKQNGVEVIVRPRPFTPLQKFREFAGAIIPEMPDAVHITKDESVREWILASDVIISSYSTSLIEAAVAGKPAYIVEPCAIPPSLHMPWHDLVPRIKSGDDLKTACDGAHSGNVSERLETWARNTMMSRGDPLQNLADYIIKLSKGDLPHPLRPPRQSFQFVPVSKIPPGLLYDYYKFYRRFDRLRRKFVQRPFSLPSTNEKDFISAADIQKRVDRWKRVLCG